MSPTLAAVLGVLAFAQQPQSAPKSVPRLGLEVLNPGPSGRRIVHLEDAIGPKARPVGNDRPAKVMLIHLVPSGECASCPATLAKLKEAAAAAKARGGLIVVLVSGRIEDRPKARRTYQDAPPELIVAYDAYGLGKKRLGLAGPGASVIFDANGQAAAEFGPMEAGLDRALAAFERQLAEEVR